MLCVGLRRHYFSMVFRVYWSCMFLDVLCCLCASHFRPSSSGGLHSGLVFVFHIRTRSKLKHISTPMSTRGLSGHDATLFSSHDRTAMDVPDPPEDVYKSFASDDKMSSKEERGPETGALPVCTPY